MTDENQKTPPPIVLPDVWSQSATSTYRPPVRRGDYDRKRRRVR